MEKYITQRGVYLDLTKSPFIFSYKDTTFIFNSEFRKQMFLNHINDIALHNKRISRIFSFDIFYDILYDYLWVYKNTQKDMLIKENNVYYSFDKYLRKLNHELFKKSI